MELQEKEAREVLTKAGMTGVAEFSVKKLVVRLNKLPELVDQLTEPEDQEVRSVFHRVLKARGDGEEVSVVIHDNGAAPAAQTGNGKATKVPKKGSSKVAVAGKATKVPKKGSSKVAVAGKEAKQDKGSPKAARETLPKDRFGSREGSDIAKVNAVLSRKAKTMAQIQMEAGVKRTYYDHLQKLIDKGLVERNGKEYRLTGKK